MGQNRISLVAWTLIFLAMICSPVAAQRELKKGESTITGRVVFADTGAPVRRAAVRLMTNVNYPASRATSTNSRGEFRFNEVAAGTYFVTAQAPGGVSAFMLAITEFGVSADVEPEYTRVSVDGKSAVRCEVRVSRGNTIRGAIVYSDKEPVTGARIVLFWRKNGGTRPLYMEPVNTNDRGMYRIDGLPDGEYFVGVMNSKSKILSNREDARHVVTAYYPGVDSITDAKVIQVQSGSEVKSINMTLGDDELRQVSGVVKWKDGGKVVSKAVLMLRKTDEPATESSFRNVIQTITPPGTNNDDTMFRDMAIGMLMSPPTIETNLKGEWTFEDLPPGKYLLAAYASLSEKDKPLSTTDELTLDESDDRVGTPDRPLVSRKIELTIGDEDLKDVVIELSEGGRVSGVVVAEESALPRVRISVAGRDKDFLDALSSTVTNGATFMMEGVPGGDIRLDAQTSSDEDLYVKSIMLGNHDLMRDPIKMTEDAEIAGVRITVGKGLATLGGRVQFDEGGPIVAGGGVLLVKADPVLWGLQSSRLFGATDPAGEFLLKCAPGDYLVFAWVGGGQPMQSIEGFVRSNLASARRITLQSREEKRIELTVTKPKR